MNEGRINKCKLLSLDVRRGIIDVAHFVGKKGVHIGSALSTVEILSALYGCGILKYDVNNPLSSDRDFFILSKGHAYLALYVVLSKAGFFSMDFLKENFMVDNGLFPVHPVQNFNYGIEFSGGSLGTGISYAVGKAYSLKQDERINKTYVLLGDGECNEGSVWEALESASHLQLSNLTVIIDRNGMQQDGATDDILRLNLPDMIKSAGLNVLEINGHSAEDVLNAFDYAFNNGKPKCIIANTIKGKGVSFMENDNYWHHAFMTEKQYTKAIEELNK